jgi:transcriptional regulator with XRE-family HTH domain
MLRTQYVPRERVLNREVAAEVSDNEVQARGPARPRTVAQKLNRLFEVLHPPGARPLNNRELASRVKEHGGSISPTYISQLRSGARGNPTLEHLIGIASAFGVPAGYFTDPEVADRVDAELDRLVELQQAKPELAEIAEMQVTVNLRTANLDASDKAELDEMVQAFWQRRKQRRAQ